MKKDKLPKENHFAFKNNFSLFLQRRKQSNHHLVVSKSKKRFKSLFITGLLSSFSFLPLTALPIHHAVAQAYIDSSSANQKFQQDAFVQLRFTALALDTLDEVGQALEGIVRALLAKDDIISALEETARIETPIWKSRAFLSIAKHLRINGDKENAKKYLIESLRLAQKEEQSPFTQHIYKLVSSEYAILGDLDNSIFVARMLQDPLARMASFQLAAQYFLSREQKAAPRHSQKLSNTAVFRDDKSYIGKKLNAETLKNIEATPQTRSSVIPLLRATFDEAAQLPKASKKQLDILVNIARSQTDASDVSGAHNTLEFALRKVIAERDDKAWHSRALARIASSYTYAGSHGMAMDVMRLIPEGGERAIALSAVARSLALRGNLDASLPLFALASDQVKILDDIEHQQKVYSLLIRDLAVASRLADAFEKAGYIRDRKAQALALTNMGFVLIDQEKFRDAEKLLDYIPYLSMRAPIFTAIAKNKNKTGETPERASEILAQALEPVIDDISIEQIPNTIEIVLLAQLEYGAPEYDEGIFRQAIELTKYIEDNLTRVNALASLAKAEAKRQRYKNAKKLINNAWTLAFLHSEGPEYEKALANIASAQVAAGQLLDAMDTAARIPVPSPDLIDDRAPDGSFRSARFDSITEVGVAAAKGQDTDMAIRTARLILHPPARAAALAAVSVAIARPDASTRNIIGMGPLYKSASDPFEIRSRKQEITEETVIGLGDFIRSEQTDPTSTQDTSLEFLEKLATDAAF